MIVNKGHAQKKRKTREQDEGNGRRFRHVWKAFVEDAESKKHVASKYSPEKNGVVRTAHKLNLTPNIRLSNELFNEFVYNLLNATPDIESNIENVKSISGLEAECRFTKKIFTALSSFDLSASMSHSEATFNNSLLFPCLLATIYLLQRKTVLGPVFVPGEEPLWAMSHVLEQSKVKTSGRKTYHADAIFRLENLSGLEVLLPETAGPFKAANDRKIAFDNIKRMFALLAMVKTVVDTFPYASVTTFRRLKLFFIQASNADIRLWSIQYDTNGLYKYNREAKVTIKEGIEVGETYVPFLDFFLQVQSSLVETFNVLQELHVGHDEYKTALKSENSQEAFLLGISHRAL